QLVRIDEDDREGGRQNQARKENKYDGKSEIRVRQQQSERRGSQDGEPDQASSAEFIGQHPAKQQSDDVGDQKDEQNHLRVADRQVEMLDRVERVIAADHRDVDVFGKDENH